jgi:hypothetical protein
MEMITYDIAFKYTPLIAPSHFERQNFEIVGREDNKAVRWAMEGHKSGKGAMVHGVKSVLCSQVQHSFLIEYNIKLYVQCYNISHDVDQERVSSTYNIKYNMMQPKTTSWLMLCREETSRLSWRRP